MRLFKWTKLHAAFVPEIDAEHRNLFRLGDELQQAVQSSAGAERVRSVMQAVLDGAEDHFAHEERLMRLTHYATFQWHKQQHDGARRRLKQYFEAFENGDNQAPLLCAEHLADWLKDHTSLTDRMFGAYLRNYTRHQAVAS